MEQPGEHLLRMAVVMLTENSANDQRGSAFHIGLINLFCRLLQCFYRDACSHVQCRH